MRRKIIAIAVVAVFAAAGMTGMLATANNGNDNANSQGCTTIQSGEVSYSDGHYLDTVHVGYDMFGYNYQAHMFKGSYANAYLGSYGYPPYGGDDDAYYQRLVDEGYVENTDKAEDLMEGTEETEGPWYWPYRDIQLKMKWNDAWLSNKDCDGDGKLDRHYGYETYIGSGAWLTNHMKGGQGKDSWVYFSKIVAAPEDASIEEGIWYTADGTEIGPAIWGSFAKIQTVESGEGATYVSPAGPGFGQFK